MLKKYELYCTAAFLIALYIFSFFLQSLKTKEKFFSSALINPSYREQISSITIKDNQSELLLEKTGGGWKGQGSQHIDFPVSREKMQQFLETFCKIRKIYIHSEKKSEQGNYGLDGEAVQIFYTLQNGESYSLEFGNHDFTGAKIFIKNHKDQKIFETSSEVDFYLTTFTRFWAASELIPADFIPGLNVEATERIVFTEKNSKKVLVYKSEEDLLKIKKIFDLRHGNICGLEGNKYGDLKIYYNSEKPVELEFYKSSNEDFIVKYNIPGLENYSAEVSQWTFNQIKNQFR